MPHFSYLVTQPHDTTRWADGDETTWNESLHTSLFGCLGERDLVLLFGRTDTADNHINTSQRFDEVLLWGLQVAFPNLASPILEARDSWLLGRDRANKSDDLLFSEKSKQLVWGQLVGLEAGPLTKLPVSNSPLAIEPPVSPAAPTSKTLVDIIIRVNQNGVLMVR